MSVFGHGEDRFSAVWSRGAELAHGGSPEAWLQRLAPRTRVYGALLLLAATTAARDVTLLLGIYALCCVAAAAGRLDLVRYLRTNLLGVALFVAPAAVLGALSVFSPGETAFRAGPLTFSRPGIRTAELLCIRALDAVAITTLMVRSLGLRGTLDGFRSAGLPESVTAVLHLSLGHIHLLARTARDMVLGMRARTVRPRTLADSYRSVSVQGVVLLHKSAARSRDTHAAMLARGFKGDFTRTRQDDPRWRRADVAVLTGCVGTLVWALAGF